MMTTNCSKTRTAVSKRSDSLLCGYLEVTRGLDADLFGGKKEVLLVFSPVTYTQGQEVLGSLG